MNKDSGRRWLVAALGLFLVLLLGWVLLALQLTSALAGPLPFAPRLVSNLRADYGPDEGGRSIAVISLSILGEAMQAMGLTEDEAAAAHASMELAMSQPVPTATALNFAGDAPFTATPTATYTPLPTDTPTATPTNTRRPPTRTPTASKTPKPTNPPATAAPTSAASPTAGPTGSADIVNPTVVASAGDFSPPPPNNGGSCTIDVDDVQVIDPAFSSGINQVYAKVEVDDGSTVQTYTFLLNKDSGGFVAGPGSTWDAEYDGTIDLTGKVLTGNTVTVYIKAKDFANGVWVYSAPFIYNWGCDC